MLGIEGPCVWLAYLLCLASALLCIAYGAANWNRGDEPARAEDGPRAKEEGQTEEEA